MNQWQKKESSKDLPILLYCGYYVFQQYQEYKFPQKEILKIAQFYLLEPYQHLGYGTYVLNKLFELNPQVKNWYVDTIMQEEYNVEFYKHLGFEVIDEEEEHEGLSFVTLLKKIDK